MLRTRLWMGSILILLAVGMLLVDQHVPGLHPFQLVFQLGLALAGCYEWLALLGDDRAPHRDVTVLGIVLLTLLPWICPLTPFNPWSCVLGGVVGLHLAIFLVEMLRFQEPGRSVERMARTWWGIGYLGLLPCFFAQLRGLYPAGSGLGTTALALAIFVPKGCDIGAYFTGKLLGKHKMTPVLSPKKTWEGAIGGIAFAALVAIGLDRWMPDAPLHREWWIEIGFGVFVGATGMLGDLAESLLKRDCQKKDASTVVPGFGGVLDVVDAVIFAAPVVYLICWLLA